MAQDKQKNPADIINIFKSKFASSVNYVYICSLDKEVAFNEISVNQQKKLSKNIILHENNQSAVYDIQNELINSLVIRDANINPDGISASFDIANLTELDRVAILAQLYADNFIQSSSVLKCPNCGSENSISINLKDIVDSFKKLDATGTKNFTIKDNKYEYSFELKYPTVRRVALFYKLQHSENNKSKLNNQNVNELATIDYLTIFISSVTVKSLTNEDDVTTVACDYLPISDMIELISTLPQYVLLNETGLIANIAKTMIEPMNNGIFKGQYCAQCETELIGSGETLNDFF